MKGNTHTSIHYVELDPFLTEIETIQNHLTFAIKMLNSALPDSYLTELKPTFQSIKIQSIMARKKYNSLTPKRMKRGLISGLGNLDADDAEKYENAINKLKTIQNKAFSRINEQISLSQHIIATFNTTLSTLKRNEYAIANRIQTLTSNKTNAPFKFQ
ncbi:hypothetical protein JTB14_023229 [Gonioctena quinquepunctata]|nr:hypothetical protein JTB14_023229 [Gonioctena quinquepunctata]